MIAVDTSVVVRGFAAWHPGHAAAVAVLGRRPHLIAHVALEAFSVLTRLPEPHRAPANAVTAFLDGNFGDRYLSLPADALRALVGDAPAIGLTGGSIYDAAIAIAAREAQASLVSADRRAARVYEAVGVTYELLP